ncbi:hypothetical protein [Dethiobacter alkaliphilus]|uniref:hypothetical protein n=1 Tax=Dethiobacter alkaliphilus TaxID=427926 RepID=UPI002226A21F|nr:hypothetical protein [Dethiobacter alkaliphilus]MCW3491608.1 hypothetical protein [Dethiobacter alkaliphilus]
MKGGIGVNTVVLSVILVLVVIYIVPFFVYGVFSKVAGLKPPEGVSPAQFLLSVFISKVGTAIAFVLLFYFGRGYFSEKWLLYAFIWWVMFVIDEMGQAMGPNYSWSEAVAGIISETVYFPTSAYLINLMIGT